MRLLGFACLAAVTAVAQPGVTPPRLVSKTEPQYTEEARKAGVNSTVVLKVTVAADGVPKDFQVLRHAGFGLDERAIEAVRTWRFQPGMKDGTPVAVFSSVEVNFRLISRGHNREGQLERLNFTLAPGVSRPMILHGVMPGNPQNALQASVRVGLTVDANGNPQDVAIVESNPPEWGIDVVKEVKKWRFVPASDSGKPVDAKGVLELTVGGR
jgi:TonB family protein